MADLPVGVQAKVLGHPKTGRMGRNERLYTVEGVEEGAEFPMEGAAVFRTSPSKFYYIQLSPS